MKGKKCDTRAPAEPYIKKLLFILCSRLTILHKREDC